MASTTILSDNGASSGSAGIKTTGGNDGVLLLQTTTAGGTATTAVTINTSQNVGIGTSSPSYKLQIGGSVGAGTSPITAYLNQKSNWNSADYEAMQLGLSQLRSVYASGNNWDLTFQTYAGSFTEKMRIDYNGNVGIGTATPTSPDGTNADNPLNGIVETVYGSSPAINLTASSSTGWSLVNFGRNGGTTNPYRAVLGYDQTNDLFNIAARNQILFKTGVDVDSSTERMRIDNTGNVGIGTTAPTSVLEVFSTSTATSKISTSNNAGYSELHLQNTGASGREYIIGLGGNTSGYPGSIFIQDVTAGANRLFIDSSGNLKFNSGYGSAATAYGCRAWVNFNGTGTVAIRASGNVSSITDNGTGDYTVNFTAAMPDANYALSGICQEGPGGTAPDRILLDDATSPTASLARILVINHNSNALVDSSIVMAMIIR